MSLCAIAPHSVVLVQSATLDKSRGIPRISQWTHGKQIMSQSIGKTRTCTATNAMNISSLPTLKNNLVQRAQIKGDEMTPAQARKDATKVLNEAGITYRALKSRTVSFEDLARASMVFVEVYGVQCTAGQWDAVDGKHEGYILKARS